MPAIPTTFPTQALFSWYDRHGRDLPWRRRWPDLAEAYHVWLSEIMLQQTVVATVIPYFLDFTRRWPDVHALAAAPLDDVLAAWAGLGYYARARNLHKAAKMVAEDLGGQFPTDEAALRILPGVGAYTAGAIAALASGRQSVVVDGNIERLFSRFFGINTPLPKAKSVIAAHYQAQLPVMRPSDFPQALMDFANAVCTPKQPGCDHCPFASSCRGLALGIVYQLPVKPAKQPKPVRKVVAFVAVNRQGAVLLEQRPEKGLLGGMLGFPEVGLVLKERPDDKVDPSPPFAAHWVSLAPRVTHVFTHFIADVEVRLAEIDPDSHVPSLENANWQRPRPSALPSLMRKIWDVARKASPR